MEVHTIKLRLDGHDTLFNNLIMTLQSLQKSVERLTEANEKVAEETGKWIEVLRDAGGAVRTVKRLGRTKAGIFGIGSLMAALWAALTRYFS